MRQQEFEQLITDAGLNLVSTWAPRFVVSLYVPTEIATEHGVIRSTRVQCDTIAYQPDEFIMRPPEACRRDIEACKARLERAAHTQQGVICYPTTEKKATPKKQSTTPAVSAIAYPAH